MDERQAPPPRRRQLTVFGKAAPAERIFARLREGYRMAEAQMGRYGREPEADAAFSEAGERQEKSPVGFVANP